MTVTMNKPATTTRRETTALSSILQYVLSQPSFSWLAVFIPALSYFIVTRFASVDSGISIGGAARVGPVLTNHVQLLLFRANSSEKNDDAACQSLSQLLYLSSPCPSPSMPSSSSSSTSIRLAQPLLIAQTHGLEDIVATTWRHDEEIGRGYLLLSQSTGGGRVWRWEVGGGPFAIGKTLHLDQAGCRSNQYLPCSRPSSKTSSSSSGGTQQQQLQQQHVGSGGLAIDFGGQERFTQGHLVVAEWGEGRIVRMEDNGARTPLLLHVPNLCEATATNTDSVAGNEAQPQTTAASTSSADVRRIHQPTQLLFTPFGDLMVLERNLGCNSADGVNTNDDESAIFIMRQAVHVPALTSLSHSRHAHSWTSLNHNNHTSSSNSTDVHVMLHRYQNKYKHTIGGMALTPQWTSIYVSTRLQDDVGSVLLLQVPIVSSDDEEDDDNEDDATVVNKRNVRGNMAEMVLNLTQHLPLIQQAGPIAVTRQGYVFIVAPPYGLVLMHLPAAAAAAANSGGAASTRSATAAARVLGHLEIPQPVPSATRSTSATKADTTAKNNNSNTPVTTITSLTLGEDGYLYMSTSPGGALLRLRIRDHPVKVPVNLVTNQKNKS